MMEDQIEFDKLYNQIKDKNVKKFLLFVKKETSKHNCGLCFLDLTRFKMPYSDSYYIGCFNGIKIYCSIKHPIEEWLRILTHEFCHLIQSFTDVNFNIKRSSYNVIQDWISGKKYSNKIIKKSILNIKQLELDCEKKAVDMIKKHSLPVDIDRYIQKANAFIHSFDWVYLRRKWFTCRSDQGADAVREKIYDLFPTNFLKKYDEPNTELTYELDVSYKEFLLLNKTSEKKSKKVLTSA